jgi:hypothetical protein
MPHKTITEADIEALAIAQSFERGYDYYHSGPSMKLCGGVMS